MSIGAQTDRLGIRGFKPELRKASARIETLRTPENVLLPPNILAGICRDIVRLAVIREQIKAIEEARLEGIRGAPDEAARAMVRLLAHVIGVGIESADMLVRGGLASGLQRSTSCGRAMPV